VSEVQIVEVGPRDGFQSVGPLIPTQTKIEILQSVYSAGVRRAEITSFVSKSAVPQLADAEAVLSAAEQLQGLDAQVLVPTERQAARAIDAGATHFSFVLSVSDTHNYSNVKRSTADSIDEYHAIARGMPKGARMRLNLATAFDCPYERRVAQDTTLSALERLLDAHLPDEIALCDTTGRVTPDHVATLFERCQEMFPEIDNWAFHAHDTYGLGAANTLAAWNVGVRIFDASFAGLGGCPFAPGATGNVATEDLVWMFEGMAISTGINLPSLLATAHRVAMLDGAQTGGRVREALSATCLS
jgi:hydroxymethylglutaryl-CoA lyase